MYFPSLQWYQSTPSLSRAFHEHILLHTVSVKTYTLSDFSNLGIIIPINYNQR